MVCKGSAKEQRFKYNILIINNMNFIMEEILKHF